jgi:hypothetical protein
MFFQKGHMRLHRFNRHLTFLLILLLHVAITLIWLEASTSPQIIKHPDKNKVLFLIATAPQKPTVKIAQVQALIKAKPRSTITHVEKKAINKSEHSTAEFQTQVQANAPASETPAAPVPLQKDIRALSQSLKEDFLKQEKNFRPDGKSSSENMKKFSNAMTAAALVQREGVIIEKKFAYDGRPVSKIKTPYGTYCIRHPKAGEKLELSPPPMRVSCGEL